MRPPWTANSKGEIHRRKRQDPNSDAGQRSRRLQDWSITHVSEWQGIGLPTQEYGTHSLRRAKASIIYKATGNLRAVQILLGHAKIDSTVRYLGVDVEDALELSERTEV